MPAIREYPLATSLLPTDAFVIDRLAVGTMYIQGLGLETGAPYFAAFEFLGGTPPLTLEMMGGHVFTAAVNMPVNFAGVSAGTGTANAVGHCETNPTGSFAITIYKVAGGVGTSIGTMTISTLGAFTFSVATAQAFAQGDSIKFVAPAGTDATLANLWWTVPGTLV